MDIIKDDAAQSSAEMVLLFGGELRLQLQQQFSTGNT